MLSKHFIGLGIAGNFAGHLEQAGEDRDFAQVKTIEITQPKALFPFYVPSKNLNINYEFLQTYPLSSSLIRYPDGAANLQIEPEIALFCKIHYENQKVTNLVPSHFAAYNDCSIRRPNARKICEKKNWGIHSKGIAENWLALDHFSPNANIDRFRLACFHKRNGVLTEYGVNSPATGYSYFHQKLLDWIVQQMNEQQNEGPMDEIAPLLRTAHFPRQALISIGATRYTEFGATHFLQPNDTSIVVVYNGDHYSQEEIKRMAASEQFPSDISVLIQKVSVF